MSRPVVLAAAVGAFALSLLILLLALNLLPTRVEAVERGTYAPWMVTWIMAWSGILCGVVLAGYLVLAGLRTGRPSSGAVARVR